MTVHMVRVLCEPPKGEAETAINNWVSNFTEWENDPASHSLVETNTRVDGAGTAYVRGDWRFIDEGETPTSILLDLSDRLQSIQGGLWHRLGYHVCDHDESSPTACEWNQVVNVGTIPADIPSIEVTG